jgi:ribonuclease P protein component
MPARFPRSARLRKRGDFTGVFDRGTKRHGRLMTVVALATPSVTPRIGIAASRKFGGAVDRNRAKRRLREVFRQAAMAVPVDVVVIPRRELLTAPFELVAQELTGLVDGALRHARRPSASTATPRRPRRDKGV